LTAEGDPFGFVLTYERKGCHHTIAERDGARAQ
jgi:hypothetical protein